MKFQKPKPEEVTAYARKIGFILDGHQFCDFYESKGWKVGSSPMKVWEAAVRTWKAKEPRVERWGPLKPTQTPPDAVKLAEANKRMDERRQREWDRREIARLSQMKEGSKSRDSREMIKRPAIPVEIKKCVDENGYKWIEEMERARADGE